MIIALEKIILASALILALVSFTKFALPMISNVLSERRKNFLNTRVLLQNRLKDSRKNYQHANMMYFEIFEKKVMWMEDAKIIVEQKIEELKKKQQEQISELHDHYHLKKSKIRREISETYLHDMMNALEENLKHDDANFDYIKILSKCPAKIALKNKVRVN